MSQTLAIEPRRAGFFRRLVAGILDTVFIFFAAGFAIGAATGGLTEGGFRLEGGSAFLLFAAVIAYFVVFSRFLGGTLFQRLFLIR
ncbi:RDD family protein [Muricoccus radiodurans]|uniref:RDD family protein n=1 Tax=Muricoccus radiodurans TaxID=2231721 RepID=UPI003CE93575